MGVFPLTDETKLEAIGLPHARGGVSSMGLISEASPMVFPTLVGVFPCFSEVRLRDSGLPHARGGVSHIVRPLIVNLEVFPTLVGVFPRQPIER